MGNCQNIPDDDSKRAPIKNRGRPQVLIKTYTWPRDSHGLFDYESKTLSKKNLKTGSTGKISRNGNEVHLLKDIESNSNKNEKDLMNLILKDGNFWAGSCFDNKPKKNEKEELADEDWENIDQSVWLVVKSFKANAANKIGYKLNEGELIKLGRVKFRIREIKSTPTLSSNKSSNKNKADEEGGLNDSKRSINNMPSLKDSVTGTSVACRICLSEFPEPGNPFFSPCNCAGTMKYVHVNCLQRWLKSKLHTKQTGHATSIYWKTLECELCKKQFPNILECEGKKYDMIEIEKPDCAYIILDILSKDKNVCRGVHVVKMESKNSIRLGRGHDSDIRITDISVSRCHALIKLDKGSFYLEDNNSKFGTLVHVKKPFPVYGDYNNISVQIGRTVVALTVKKNWKILPACFSQSENVNTSGDEGSEAGEDILMEADNDILRPASNMNNRNAHNNEAPIVNGSVLMNNNEEGQADEENQDEVDDDLFDEEEEHHSENENGQVDEFPNDEQVNAPHNQNN